MTKLTPTQETILLAASARADGNIEPLPHTINSGIKPRVIQGLLTRNLITQTRTIYCINAKGFDAIGAPQPKKIPRPPREGTKQAKMIALMQQPHGASLDEICQATGWQRHTVRGTLAGTLKKRLGLDIESHHDENRVRRYRIVESTIQQAQQGDTL